MTAVNADPPVHNLELEQAVIQSVLTRETNRGMLLTHLDPEHFYDRRHQAIFRLCRMLNDRESALDGFMLNTELLQSKTLAAQCGGLNYVTSIWTADLSLSPYNARIWIRELRELAKGRRDLEIGQQLSTGGLLPDRRIQLVEELAAPAWNEKQAVPSTGALVAATEMWEGYLQTAARFQQGIRFKGLDCGFEPLNDHLSGLCCGELTVIAARSGIGKSTLAIQISLGVAARSQASVGYITVEMTPSQITERFCGILAEVHPGRIRRGSLTLEEQDRLQLAVNRYSQLPVEIYGEEVNIAGIKACIQQHPNIQLWVVDYLQRIAGGSGENEHLRISGITKEIGNLSLKLNCHILLLSQLNRQCESRQDRMPQIGDLRGSGSIEEDAVNVLLIHRPGYYKELRKSLEAKPDELEALLHAVTIYIEKSRFEGPGARDLRWRPGIAAFGNPLTYEQTYAPQA